MSTLRTLGIAALAAAVATESVACPFCAAESRTLTEEMNDASVTMLARLAAPSEASQRLADADIPYGFIDPETGSAKFSVEDVLIGAPLMEGVTEVEAIYFGEPDTERHYLIRGVGEPPDWAIPLPLSPVAAEYVPKLLGLPAEGADRLAFFQDYLEHEDPLLGQDAYDEFARAPYKDVVDLGPRMDRDQLLDWVEDVRVSPSRRRLFLTMLGVCGKPEDVQRLERMLTSDARVLGPATEAGAAAAMASGGSFALGMQGELVRFAERQRKLGLDALIACYMTLAGKHGEATAALDLVDERFLQDPEADYSHVYAALQALRFLAEEQRDLVPLDRLLQSARLLLDNPEFADQVIPDLARWEDWSVLEQLSEMYQSTFDESDENAPVKYVREPIVTYLDVAVEQPGDVGERAQEALAVIEPLDPKAVERARSLRAFGFLAQARAKSAAKTAAETPADPQADPAGDIAVDFPPDEDEALSEEDAAAATADASQPAANQPAEALATATPSENPAAGPEGGSEDAGPAAGSRPLPPALEVPPPPSRVLLVGAPLAAAALLVGLFWLILRGGVA